MPKIDHPGGVLSQHFIYWLNHWVAPLPPNVVTELRRAFYAGAASVIDTIDGSDSDEMAAQAIVIMKAEINICADELNAADDHARRPDA